MMSPLAPIRDRARFFAGLRASSILTVMTLSRLGFAQSKAAIELVWDAPSQCPTANDVQDHIRGIVGDLEVPPTHLRAEGRILRIGERYRLTLVITSGTATGTRELESDSCEHLAGAAGVALSLLVQVASTTDEMLTPDVLGEPFPGSPRRQNPTQETTSSGSGPPVTEHKPQRPEPESREDLGSASKNEVDVHLRLPTVATSLGTAPGLTVGYGLGLGVTYAQWEGAVTGYYWPERHISSQWPGYGANLTRYSADLDICRTWRVESFEAGPCVRAGVMRAIGSGTGTGMVLKSASATVFTAGAALMARFYFSKRIALLVTGGSEMASARPQLVNPAFGQIYEFARVSFKFSLGSEWIF